MSVGKLAAVAASLSSACGLLWHAVWSAIQVGHEGFSSCRRLSALLPDDLPFETRCQGCNPLVLAAASVAGLAGGLCLGLFLRRPWVSVERTTVSTLPYSFAARVEDLGRSVGWEAAPETPRSDNGAGLRFVGARLDHSPPRPSGP